MSKYRWQFSSRSAQQAEALLNAREARALADRHAPLHLREQAPSPSATEAGACFRRVCQILSGKVSK